MHTIDLSFSKYANQRNFSILCNLYHSVAEKLEEQGYETNGLNDDLYIKLQVSEKEILYLYIHCTSEDNTIEVEDQRLSFKIPTKIDDFPKLFNKESHLVKGILEYRQLWRQFRMSMASKFDMAIKMDKI